MKPRLVSDKELIEKVIRKHLPKLLAEAWQKYKWLYGVEPHGTEVQLASMIEFAVIRKLSAEIRRAKRGRE